jgi:hypothetical protein
MSQRNEPPKRLRNPNADDETGKRLVRAALELMNDGVALHDLRLADAVERASASKPDRPLSRGAAYPRFSSQADFRLAVLREILREGQGANRREGGQRLLDLLETEMSRSEPMPPKALQELIEKIGAEQIRRIAEDPLFVLRIYALKALEDGLFVGDDELVEKVRALEQDSRQQWTNLLGLLAGEYGLEPRAGLSIADFEMFVSALSGGFAMKRLLASDADRRHLDELFGKVVAATALAGFFVVPVDEPRTDVWTIFRRRLRGGLKSSTRR